MSNDNEVWAKLIVGVVFVGAWCVNLVKLIGCATSDQVGLERQPCYRLSEHWISLIAELSSSTEQTQKR